MSNQRDHSQEYRDTEDRKYAYNIDYKIHEFMFRTFRPFIREGRALEMGCYKGEFTARLLEHYSDVTVVEAVEELVSTARARVDGKAKFVNSTFEDAELDGNFDAIFLTHTLEHLDNAKLVLERIKGWLSPKGRLFLVVPNANAASRQIAVKMDLIRYNSAVTEGEESHGHRKTYSFDTLEDEVRQAGLKVKHRAGVMFKPVANFQFDKMLEAGIIDDAYVEGCYQLGMQYPDLCASIFLLCGRDEDA